MPSTRLIERRVDALVPRKKSRDVRDPSFKAFGVRNLPSAMPERSPWKVSGPGQEPCRQ